MFRSTLKYLAVLGGLVLVGALGVTAQAAYDVRLVDSQAWANSHVPDSIIDAPSSSSALIGLWVHPTSDGGRAEGGFDFLIRYDNIHATFVGATRGADLHPEWEYFTYRYIVDSAGSGSASMVRVVGVADLNDGATPDQSAFNLTAVIAELEFYVANNGSTDDLCIPFNFYSQDCGDNAIAPVSGDTLYIPQSGHVAGPEWNSDSCVALSPETIIPDIAFTGCAICVAPAPPISLGDINANGIAYEIGDAVLFSKFFTFGFDIFTSPSPGGQFQATDINCDGIRGSVVDFVYLIGIITGGKQPCELDSSTIASNGLVPSDEDTLRAPTLSVVLGEVFDVDIELINVDSVGALSFRLTYDPSILLPIGTLTDSVLEVGIELLRNSAPNWSVSAAVVEPGVITGAALSFYIPSEAILPGSGPTIRMQFESLPGSGGQASALLLQPDPIYPNVHNALADVNASIWKRPVLVSGEVSVYDFTVGDRGDINLNGIAYEIGDFVLFTRFFSEGFGVFTSPDPQVQYQASDINCDTLPGSLVDLTYMLGIITGDLLPCDGVPPPPPATGPMFSITDTLRVPDVTTGPGDVFDLEIGLANVDPLAAVAFRLTYDTGFMLPLGSGADTISDVVAAELLRPGTNDWTVVTRVIEPGVITGLASASVPGSTPLAPGSGPTIRLSFQAFHGSVGQSSPVHIEVDPAYPHVHNALADAAATVWKRPVLVDGTVTVTEFCDCPSQADMDGNGILESVDFNAIIQVIYFNGANVQSPSCPATCADFDGNGYPDAVDINLAVNHMFFNGPGPTNPCE